MDGQDATEDHDQINGDLREKSEGVPLPGPGPAPLALRPASRARACSSLTASRRVSGTRKYFIFFFWHAHDHDHACTESSRDEMDDRAKETGKGGRTHRTTTDVALLELPESIAVCTRLIHFA